jgi:hypothetical protein
VTPGWVAAARRWRVRAEYEWGQHTSPLVTGARCLVDNRVLPWVSVTSAGGASGPSIGYAGVPPGVVKIHQMLEQRREALGAPATARRTGLADRGALLRGDWLPDADLVAVGCAAAQASRLSRTAALVLPFRVHVLARTGDGPDGWWQRMSRSERRWSSRTLSTGPWALEVATDAASFDHFYDRMHVPTMRARHGARARSETRDTAWDCLFRHGVLAFVTYEGTRVAGLLCRWGPDQRVLTIRLVGVLDGLPEYYRNGAMRATDHLLMGWAAARGVPSVDFGGAEPFLSQGIFQRKRLLASTAVIAPNHFGRLRLWWHARRDTPRVRDFLAANPVVEMTGDRGLRAVYFCDEQRPPRLDLAATREGIDGYRVLPLDEFFAVEHRPALADPGADDQRVTRV